MALNLHLLRLFASVVEHDGFSAAARAIHVSQPAISRAVRDLEAQLGVPLLERTTRGVKLTDAGATLYAHARGVFASERAAEEAMAELKGVRRGRLHVGASSNIATYALPAVVGHFVARHPGIEFQLSAVHTRQLCDMLLAYEIDVAIAEAPVDDPRIEARRWRWDEMVIIAAPGHPLARRHRIPPAALAEELLILREAASGTRELVLSSLRDVGVTPGRTIAVDTAEAIKQLVAVGCGIGIVSRVAAAELLQLGRVVALDVAGLDIRRAFNVLHLRDHRPSAAAAAFHAVLAEYGDRPRIVTRVRSA